MKLPCNCQVRFQHMVSAFKNTGLVFSVLYLGPEYRSIVPVDWYKEFQLVINYVLLIISGALPLNSNTTGNHSITLLSKMFESHLPKLPEIDHTFSHRLIFIFFLISSHIYVIPTLFGGNKHFLKRRNRIHFWVTVFKFLWSCTSIFKVGKDHIIF